MTNDPIELDVRARDPVDFDVAGSHPVEWGASEYIPVIATDAPEYEGPYEVTPRLVEQTLATTNRLMRQDVGIEAIPSFRTTNEGGGYTVVIAQD